jgi:cytoskeletal protein RodZ
MSSLGEKLRRAREARDVKLEEIAASTKISVRYLKAIETGNFDQLPGGVFDRGFVRAYAQFVGLNPDAMVDAFVRERGPRETESEGASLDALRSAVDAKSGRAAGAPAGTPGRITRILFVALASAGLLTVAAWAYFRYLQPPEISSSGTAEIALAQEPAETEDESDDVLTPEETPSPAAPDPPPVTEETVQTAAVPPSTRPADRLIRARVIVDRPVSGSLNCDNRRIEMLDGLRVGTVLQLECRRFLMVNADDGGAVRLGLSGGPPVALVPDGKPLDNHGIYPSDL